jgi:hypothetical protein
MRGLEIRGCPSLDGRSSVIAARCFNYRSATIARLCLARRAEVSSVRAYAGSSAWRRERLTAILALQLQTSETQRTLAYATSSLLAEHIRAVRCCG